MAKVIVVGAGLTGAVIARKLAEKGRKVTVYEKRPHIGGNIYDYIDAQGFMVQKYGPHIFHTNKENVKRFIFEYSNWKEFKLECGAFWDGRTVQTPFNFHTIDAFYVAEEANQLKNSLLSVFKEKEVSVLELLKSEQTNIKNFAEFLFTNDYLPYTSKQWGISVQEIDVSIFERVKIRLSYENGYFSDRFQYMPEVSFTEFITSVLHHPNIQIKLNSDWTDNLKIEGNCLVYDNNVLKELVVYTGPIDELCDYCFGELPYRALTFEFIKKPQQSFQEFPVVAYPKDPLVTRITEFKKLTEQKIEGTKIAKEYSHKFIRGGSLERYYPVPTKESQELYLRYKNLTSLISNLQVCGRLGDFKYYNMDQAIDRALALSQELT